MPPEEARRAALVRFGGVDKTKDETREASRAVWLETILQDVRYGLRSLRKQSGLRRRRGPDAGARHRREHGDLLGRPRRPAPVAAVRRRASGSCGSASTRRARESTTDAFSPPEIRDLQERPRSFADVVEYHSMWFVLLGKAEPERVQTGVVSASFFDLLGVRPLLGPDVPAGRGQARRRGGPRAVPRLLDARLRRRPVRRRPRLPDERPAPHGRRRPAADPRLPAGQRRLDADLGVPLPLGPGDGERPGRRHAAGVRRG